MNLGRASALGSWDLTINGGTLNNTSGSTITLNSALNINGDFTFTGASAITQQTGAVALTGNRYITVGGALTLNVNIGGTGGIMKAGAATLTLEAPTPTPGQLWLTQAHCNSTAALPALLSASALATLVQR
ncbi:MAG: hypothetical protein K8R23_17080 [Chthoniobacter sp.]|nr:hypothetical protein [Chthoniobacter sp.]